MNADDWEHEREDIDMIYESSDDERERDGIHNATSIWTTPKRRTVTT